MASSGNVPQREALSFMDESGGLHVFRAEGTVHRVMGVDDRVQFRCSARLRDAPSRKLLVEGFATVTVVKKAEAAADGVPVENGIDREASREEFNDREGDRTEAFGSRQEGESFDVNMESEEDQRAMAAEGGENQQREIQLRGADDDEGKHRSRDESVNSEEVEIEAEDGTGALIQVGRLQDAIDRGRIQVKRGKEGASPLVDYDDSSSLVLHDVTPTPSEEDRPIDNEGHNEQGNDRIENESMPPSNPLSPAEADVAPPTDDAPGPSQGANRPMEEPDYDPARWSPDSPRFIFSTPKRLRIEVEEPQVQQQSSESEKSTSSASGPVADAQTAVAPEDDSSSLVLEDATPSGSEADADVDLSGAQAEVDRSRPPRRDRPEPQRIAWDADYEEPSSAGEQEDDDDEGGPIFPLELVRDILAEGSYDAFDITDEAAVFASTTVEALTRGVLESVVALMDGRTDHIRPVDIAEAMFDQDEDLRQLLKNVIVPDDALPARQ